MLWFWWHRGVRWGQETITVRIFIQILISNFFKFRFFSISFFLYLEFLKIFSPSPYFFKTTNRRKNLITDSESLKFQFLVNTKINHTLIGEPFERKGKTYLKWVDYKVTLRPDVVNFHFANLFNGDDRLGNEINRVINENWDVVFTDVRDGYEKSFGLIFKDLANRVFTRVPLKDIFLE